MTSFKKSQKTKTYYQIAGTSMKPNFCIKTGKLQMPTIPMQRLLGSKRTKGKTNTN